MHIIVRTTVLAVCSAVLSACSSEASSERPWTEHDSAGVRIIEAGPPTTVWATDATELVRIGALIEGDSTELLDQVVYAASLPDGHVLIADDGLDRLRLYRADGEHIRTFGRPGEGPGEYGRIQSATVIGADTAVVYDSGLGRLTWVSLDGQAPHVRPAVLGRGRSVRVLGLNADGGVLLEHMEPHPVLTSADYQYSRDTVTVLSVGPGEGSDSIFRMPGNETMFYIGTSGGRPAYTLQMPLPFAAQVVSVSVGNAIVTANGFDRQIEVRDLSGGLRAITRFAGDQPRPLLDEEKSRFLDYSVEQASPGLDPTVARRNAEDWLETLPPGHARPPFDQLLSDEDDHIWVRDYQPPWNAEEPQQWTILDREGRPLARGTSPAGVTITHISHDFITGITHGDFDEQYVVVYRVIR